MILSAEELVELTQRHKPAYQARVLDHMGIPYRKRPDRSLVVLRIHVETVSPKESHRPRLRIA